MELIRHIAMISASFQSRRGGRGLGPCSSISPQLMTKSIHVLGNYNSPHVPSFLKSMGVPGALDDAHEGSGGVQVSHRLKVLLIDMAVLVAQISCSICSRNLAVH